MSDSDEFEISGDDMTLRTDLNDLCVSPLLISNNGRYDVNAMECDEDEHTCLVDNAPMDCDDDTNDIKQRSGPNCTTPTSCRDSPSLTKSIGRSILSQRVINGSRRIPFSKYKSKSISTAVKLTPLSKPSLSDITNSQEKTPKDCFLPGFGIGIINSDITNTQKTPRRCLPGFGITNHSRRSIMAEFSAYRETLLAKKKSQNTSSSMMFDTENFSPLTSVSVRSRDTIQSSPASSTTRRQCTPKLLFQNGPNQ